MCGIVGIIGKTDIQEGLLNGLQRLEYRGYDSAGVFIMDQEGQGQVCKVEGRVSDLARKLRMIEDTELGIGHTRWATHGQPSEANAHPHLSNNGRLYLVHNGVITNYLELKERYLKGYHFTSETDTEVVVNLIEYFMDQAGEVVEALRQVCQLLEGSYAFGLIDTANPGQLLAAKNKSPLLIGLGSGFNLLTSDAMATIDLTHQYVEIQDQELVILQQDSYTLLNLLGETIQRAPYQAEIDAQDFEKGTHPHYMIKEIEEQPGVIRKLLQEYYHHGQVTLDKGLVEAIGQSDRIYLVACGTSYHAGLQGKVILEAVTEIPTEVWIASEFTYHLPVLNQRPFFIFLSQSGETADSRQALVNVNKLGYPSLTITNVKGSTLSREAKYTLLLHAGPEISVASTKAYTAQVVMLAILADALKGEKSSVLMEGELSLVASAIESVLTQQAGIKDYVQGNLLTHEHVFFIGRHQDYYLALEAALKLKEISYIHTEAFPAGELRHGSIALIEEGTPVIAIISDELTAAHTRSNIEEVNARGAATVTIVSQALSNPTDTFVVPTVSPLLSPLVSTLVCQLIAYYTALYKDLDVDKPRNLAKSVTVE